MDKYPEKFGVMHVSEEAQRGCVKPQTTASTTNSTATAPPVPPPPPPPQPKSTA
jgi:hypothetical protein